jgi:tRNA-specific 2-thiouridylase
LPGGGARVVLDHAEGAIAPGQACVFYQGPRVLGGGWIASAEPAAQDAMAAIA